MAQDGAMEPLRLAFLWSRALAGAKAIPVAVEVHLGNGLPQFQNVGSLLPQSASAHTATA
jgi:hypothetical protein